MANFKPHYPKLKKREGFYTDGSDKSDKGGETLWGIARKKNPKWEGWAVVDSYKNRGTFPEILKNLTGLEVMVYNLYKSKYWDKYKLDDFNSEEIAEVIFDCYVNGGHAGMWLQRSLNVSNRNQKDWADIKADGKIGNVTAKTCNQACAIFRGNLRIEDIIEKSILSLRNEYFMVIAENNPKLEKYYNGWVLNRVMGLED